MNQHHGESESECSSTNQEPDGSHEYALWMTSVVFLPALREFHVWYWVYQVHTRTWYMWSDHHVCTFPTTEQSRMKTVSFPFSTQNCVCMTSTTIFVRQRCRSLPKMFLLVGEIARSLVRSQTQNTTDTKQIQHARLHLWETGCKHKTI